MNESDEEDRGTMIEVVVGLASTNNSSTMHDVLLVVVLGVAVVRENSNSNTTGCVVNSYRIDRR